MSKIKFGLITAATAKLPLASCGSGPALDTLMLTDDFVQVEAHVL